MFFNRRVSPIKEMVLVYIAMILFFCMYFFYSLNAWFSSPNNLAEKIVIFDKIAFVLGQIALLLIAYAFILPDFKQNYQSIYILNIMTILSISNAFYNGFNQIIEVKGNFIVTTFPPLGSLLFVMQFIFLLTIFFRRIRIVIKVTSGKTPSPLTSRPWLIIFGLIGVSTLVFYILSRLVYPETLPNYAYSMLLGALFIFFTISIYRDKSFFFITSTSLDSIIMMEQKSGLAFQAISYSETDKVPEEMISGIFSMLNISLKDTVKSDSKLEEIRFGDKIVVMHHGSWVTTLMIVSEVNFVTKSIVSYLTNKFEKKYELMYKNKNTNVVNKDNYKDFQEEFAYIRKFIPI